MFYLAIILILLIIILILLELGRVKKTAIYQSAKRRGVEEKKEKILDLFKDKNKITNNDVEELLGVSDASATNYLQELEDEGKIRQVGKTGRSVYYLPR